MAGQALVIVAGTVLCAALGAQARMPIVGKAELPDGSPWAAAEVIFLSRPVPADERVGVADMVRARSNARGRFGAQLLSGRTYTAWAQAKIKSNDKDGGKDSDDNDNDNDTYRISTVVENVTAASPLTICAEEKARPRVTVQVRGLDAWQKRGPLTILALSDTTNIVVATCKLEDGERVTIPPLPGSTGRLEVVCKGQPLFEWPREFSLLENGSLRLREPKRVLLRVVAEDTKRPIAGVELAATTLVIRPKTHSIGKTDAQGFAIVELPVGGRRNFSWINYPLLVRARGFAPVGSLPRFKVRKSHDADKARAQGKPIVTIEMTPAESLTGRIVRGGAPVQGLQLRLRTHVRGARQGEHSGMRHKIAWNIQTNEKGEFKVDVDRREALVLAALPAPKLIAETKKSAAHPVWILASLAAGQKRNLGTLNLAAWKPTKVQVHTPGKTPADAATSVAFGSADGDLLLGPCGWIVLAARRFCCPQTSSTSFAPGRCGAGQARRFAVVRRPRSR